MSKTLKREYKANSKKSLCKSKKEKKCKKIKGCKMSKGPKKTFCRKIKNKKYRKTVKKGGFTVGDAVNMASNSPMGAKLKDELKAKAEKIAKIPLDENKLHMIHMILSKLDDEKIKALMNGVKSIDQETMDKILKGDKMAIAKVIKENPKLTAEIMKETMHKGGNLDELLNSYTKNNTNRSFEDIARETKEHEQKAEEYRYKANQLAHDSVNKYQTMDNVQSRRPFFNGGK